MRLELGAGGEQALLSFVGVTVHASDGIRRVCLLEEVSFELRAGASAGLFGQARTGKSTLLRLACGLQAPERGTVRLAGVDLASLPPRKRVALLRRNVALLVDGAWQPVGDETGLDRVTIALGSTGLSLQQARGQALKALDAVQALAYAAEPASALSRGQRARVELAAALAREPALLLVDEPLPTPSVTERERFCALLRSLAAERGIALLIASEDLGPLQGLECLMSIFAGELASTAAVAPVVPLAARRSARRA